MVIDQSTRIQNIVDARITIGKLKVLFSLRKTVVWESVRQLIAPRTTDRCMMHQEKRK